MAGKRKRLLRKRKKNFKLIPEKKKDVVQAYNINFNNWSQRGNSCFNEIRKVGIHFIDEILRTKLITEELSKFGTSLSSLSNLENELQKLSENIMESGYLEGSKEFAEDLWNMLCNIVKSSSALIQFQYHMEKEKWIEIKRNFNFFQVDGETIPDITLKVVLRYQDHKHILVYYVRCLGNLIKTGIMSTKSDIISMMKAFGRNRYICIGFDKDKFLYQVDNNEKIRQYMKDYARLFTVPFESMHHTECKAVVQDSLDVGNYKFQRGEKTICGPLVVCKPCEDLYDNLEELLDPSLNNATEDYFKPPKHRYGPVESLNVSTKIKKLCTESVFEFVQEAQKNMDCFRKLGIETDVVPNESKIFSNGNSSEDERPSVTVTEQEFEKMITVQKISSDCSNSKLNKKCNKCGFETDSMLLLYTHMSSHIVATDEECEVQRSSSEIHLEYEQTNCSGEKRICTTCNRLIANKEFSCRITFQGNIKPYLCNYCDLRTQTLEEYRIHMKNVHHMKTIEDMKFSCTTCQMYFYTPNHLVIHQLNLNHLDKAGVTCRVCGCKFSSIVSFQSHILSHSCDQIVEHNLLLCRECGKFFFSKYELEHHKNNTQCSVKQNHGLNVQPNKNISKKIVKIFTSGKCFKTCNNTVNMLQKHAECSQSNQVTNSGELSTSETNSGVTPSPSSIYSFSCNLCGMKFASEYYLNIHVNLHTTNNRTIVPSNENFFIYSKRNPSVESESSKQMEKHQQQQQLHQPTQQLPTYNQVYNQQPTFSEGQNHVTQSDVMEVSSPEIDWTKHTISNIEEQSDTVYSLLHL